jgi:hypothetical protein
MVRTRAEGKADLAHVVTNVFGLGFDNPLSKALEHHGIIIADDVRWMDYNAIEDLSYLDDQGNEVPLPKSFQFLLRILQFYCVHPQE